MTDIAPYVVPLIFGAALILILLGYHGKNN